ncbi:LLM class flavin-dependent oxidoreductase [Streptomyces umbrinus]|uniref:LLM class flavin-dependent oxidoreductase n=1 Tax=Streptomyces umbrinus TaxID=67370 RepID=UPI003C2CB011
MNDRSFPFVLGISLPTRVARVSAPVRRDAAAIAEHIDRCDIDFVIVEDSPAPGTTSTAGLTPVSLLGFLAPLTSTGLIAEVDASYVEPFFASKSLATLDHVAAGRAGWQLRVDRSEAAARKHGLAVALPDDELTERVVEYADVVGGLWDSWESDAVVRDRARGIFVDADRVHHLDHSGRYFSVRGPAILPRPPQGRLPLLARLNGDSPPGDWQIAALTADLVRVRAWSSPDLAAVRERLARAGGDAAQRLLVDVGIQLPDNEGPQRVPEGLLALLDEITSAADGLVVDVGHAHGALAWVEDVLSPELKRRGLRVPPTDENLTLRERLGLPPASNRFRPSAAMPAGEAS